MNVVFAMSSARPLILQDSPCSPKHLELLVAVVPGLSRVGLLMNPGNPNSVPVLKGVDASALRAGITVVPAEARKVDDIAAALVMLENARTEAFIMAADALFNSHLRQIAESAIQKRFPSMYTQREYAEVGGLMTCGDSLKEFYRRAAFFVDKIFKGAKPAELPIEQPTRFNLVINRKTAVALGITIPSHLFIFADEVIE